MRPSEYAEELVTEHSHRKNVYEEYSFNGIFIKI